MTGARARQIVIDTDPGIDDAIGILLAVASPELAICGMTTVAGNISLVTTTRNAGRILAFAGRTDIPVLMGAAHPLSGPGPEPLDLHGEDGVGGVVLPEPACPPATQAAGEWLSELLIERPRGTVDVLALGPLTNLAALALGRPEAFSRIGRIVAMGGAIHEPGNAGRRSEFNIAADPDAAAVVLRGGVPLVLVPLDVTRRVRADRAFVSRLAAGGRPLAEKVAELIGAYFTPATNGESHPLHDPCVMLLALQLELFGCETMRLSVATAPAQDPGALFLDERNGWLVQVAMSVDAPAVLAFLEQRLMLAHGGTQA
jgi:inosine-uridine nucleoside N-ribohydrolase